MKNNNNQDELLVTKYLLNNNNNVIRHPKGSNRTPDILVNGIVAIEVMRLSQHFIKGKYSQDLQELRAPIFNIMEEIVKTYDHLYNGKTYWIHIELNRPIRTDFRKIKREIKYALDELLKSNIVPLPNTINVTRQIKMELMDLSERPGRLFVFAGLGDHDAGGWLLPEYIKNINRCLSKKANIVSKYYSEFSEWWLYLIDYMRFGISKSSIIEIKNGISHITPFNHLYLLDYSGNEIILEI